MAAFQRTERPFRLGSVCCGAARPGRTPARRASSESGQEAIGVDPSWWTAYGLVEEVFTMPKPHPPNPPTDVPPPAANGEGVRCPRCGGTELMRVRRRLPDRLLSLVRPVYRFRCADPGCAWEGTVPQKWFASDRYRRHYLR